MIWLIVCIISLETDFVVSTTIDAYLGAKIIGAGSSVIQIEGVKKLTKQNRVFTPISDRIEVGTFILAVMTTGGEIEIKNADFTHNSALIKKVYNNACKIAVFNDRIYIKAMGMGKSHGF